MKPSNILVNYGKGGEDRFSEVRLADLGGAMSIDSEFAIEGMIGGTSLYRSPEMHLGIPWGTAVDIWSFGVTVSYILAIEYPSGKLTFHTDHKPHPRLQLPHLSTTCTT